VNLWPRSDVLKVGARQSGRHPTSDTSTDRGQLLSANAADCLCQCCVPLGPLGGIRPVAGGTGRPNLPHGAARLGYSRHTGAEAWTRCSSPLLEAIVDPGRRTSGARLPVAPVRMLLRRAGLRFGARPSARIGADPPNLAHVPPVAGNGRFGTTRLPHGRACGSGHGQGQSHRSPVPGTRRRR
jgi:hypothetical protein